MSSAGRTDPPGAAGSAGPAATGGIDLAGRHALVLVGGLHRSGTTLFARCVARHPAATGFEDTGVIEDEGQFLQSVYPPAREHGGPGRFGWSPRAHLTEASPLATRATRAAILAAWAPHWDLGRRVLVEKSPPNLLKTRFLQALFPEALQVVVLRHPVAVTLATVKWARDVPLPRLLEHWVHCHELLRADAQRLQRLLVVGYETFVADADRAMHAVDSVLGLAPHAAGLEVRPGINAGYFEAFARRCRGPFGGRATRRAVERLEPRVRALGYSLEDLEHQDVATAWEGVAGSAPPAPG